MRLTYMMIAMGLALCAQPSAAQPRLQSVQDQTNTVALHIPDTWKKSNLGAPDATLQVSDEAGDVAFIVIVERKDDLYGWNLDRLHYMTLGTMMTVMDLPEISEPEDLILDGAPARRVTVRGSANGVQLVYLRAVVDAPDAYVQLIGWTSRSKWEANRDTLERILSSVDFLQTSPDPS